MIDPARRGVGVRLRLGRPSWWLSWTQATRQGTRQPIRARRFGRSQGHTYTSSAATTSHNVSSCAQRGTQATRRYARTPEEGQERASWPGASWKSPRHRSCAGVYDEDTNDDAFVRPVHVDGPLCVLRAPAGRAPSTTPRHVRTTPSSFRAGSRSRASSTSRRAPPRTSSSRGRSARTTPARPAQAVCLES
jgi:hypothetical protein